MPRPAEPINGTAPAGDLSLRAGERKMLAVLAQRYPMRFTRVQLGTLAGYTASGGTFGAYFGTLKRHGLVQGAGGEVQITQTGLNELGAGVPPQPQTAEELRSMWRAVLRGGERKMFDELIAVYPKALTREELGERTGYTASGGTGKAEIGKLKAEKWLPSPFSFHLSAFIFPYGAYLGTLKRNGLVEVDGDGMRASAGLF